MSALYIGLSPDGTSAFRLLYRPILLIVDFVTLSRLRRHSRKRWPHFTRQAHIGVTFPCRDYWSPEGDFRSGYGARRWGRSIARTRTRRHFWTNYSGVTLRCAVLFCHQRWLFVSRQDRRRRRT